MASKEEFSQLKKTVQEMRKAQLDILIRLEVNQIEVAGTLGGLHYLYRRDYIILFRVPALPTSTSTAAVY